MGMFFLLRCFGWVGCLLKKLGQTPFFFWGVGDVCSNIFCQRRYVSFWKGYFFVDSVGCVNEKTHGKDWNIFAEIWDIHLSISQRFREDFHHDCGSQWSHQLSGSESRHPSLLAALVLKEDSWNLLPQESGELQRWIRNVGQVLVVHLSREVFAWNLWIGGGKHLDAGKFKESQDGYAMSLRIKSCAHPRWKKR